jgi:hypothetical protein
MTPSDLSARPLGLAEIVDRSIALGLRHFRPLFLAMLVMQVLAVLLVHRFSGVTELMDLAADPERALVVLERLLPSFTAVYLSLFALQFLATAAAAHIVAPSLDPRRGAPRPSRTRLLAAVASASAIQVALLAAAPIVGLLPGLILAHRAESVFTQLAGVAGSALGGLGLFLVATLRLMLAPVVAALEGRAGFSALARSSRLMAPRAGSRFLDRPVVRASLVLLAILALALAVDGLAGIPRLIVIRAYPGAGGIALLGASLPLPLEIALSLFEAAAGAALQSFSLVAVAVLYFDRRARTEALDLEIWTGRLEDGA